ncbi:MULTISPECIES: efflux RND transporter periplasmic adaptor subunit [Nonlabens]|uniref:efflux RND transporter periplasmic adaptor subunit n=1 Tax=Nonlabens TaxID=363408 RepID=UPI000CF3D599|nr:MULTISPECIES: HlyD family efflux transporter periplasmic adaptor subunit [Nonlabens]PQJ13948.1 efflux transporter periplasmic adaptor subunit [Nonlabens tegetincola]
MRTALRIVLGLLIILGAAYGAYSIFNSKKKPKPKIKKEVKIVQVDTVKNTTVPIIIPAQGNLQAKDRIELYAEVSGVFKPVNKLFRTGQEYKAGETIILIDNTEFYAQVQSLRSSLNNQITALMPDLRLDYPESFQQWQDYLNNWNINAATAALPEPKSDKEKYYITGRNIYTTYYNIKNLEQRLGKYRIRAPFTGTLTEANVTEGTLVRNGQLLGEFIKSGTYELPVAVSSEFADLLKVGEKVVLENVTRTKTYTGTITRINAKIDQASQTIDAIIEVSDADLKEGMFVQAQLEAEKIDQAIEISRSLLQNDKALFTVQDSVLKLMEVNPVYFSDKTAVIKDVPDNTVIISKSLPGAYEGMLVKPEEE